VEEQETETFSRTRSIESGIERVRYIPKQRRFETPILLQHGMWHGAWCWQWWQELLAEWGWESHAYSLPGHNLMMEHNYQETAETIHDWLQKQQVA
jgi:hypothetical protein